MSQQPAVVIIARHGPRLDAADQSWHLSTPTHYDPPLTYGGWNQSRSLGVRIASLLHAREQSLSVAGEQEGVSTHDFAQLNDRDRPKDHDTDERPKKRRRVRHKVVIHTSPFLRCLQTSVAIAAGMAQYNPSIETGGTQTNMPHARMHSASPHLRAVDGPGSPHVAPISDPKHYDFAHAIAKKTLQEHRRHRKCKLRVDAFLGEWLNPSYFDGITPPPPSAMMLTTAKGELMENETVEIFTPRETTKPINANLWGGANGSSYQSKESTLDDWSPVDEAMPPLSPTRSRASTQSSTESGRRSPFRPGSALQPLTSTVPKPKPTTYHPPTPQYAVSASHQIPRGYVTHARNACTDVDNQWDSTRPPHDWGDGGEYGEEWSSMHKRFRRGLNRLIHWYSQHDSDDSVEDSLGFEQHSDEDSEQTDLVVILVTHGAGCNALIGALTGQPVLQDFGMASLTMAVRRDDAPALTYHASDVLPSESGTTSHIPYNSARRGSLDMGLSSVYEMKLVSSTEHLRHPMRGASPNGRAEPSGAPASLRSSTRFLEPTRSHTSSALGSIRRPSNINVNAAQERSTSLPRDMLGAPAPATPTSAGLWSPIAARSPLVPAQAPRQGSEERPGYFSSVGERGRSVEKASSNVTPPTSNASEPKGATTEAEPAVSATVNGQHDGAEDESRTPTPVAELPPPASKAKSKHGLWGTGPADAKVKRTVTEPKRRWTVNED